MRLLIFFLASFLNSLNGFQATSFDSFNSSDMTINSFHPIRAFNDYSETIRCDKSYYGNDEKLIEDALNRINLRWIDSIVFISLGTVTFFSTLFIILTFIKYPQAREPPGDIILGISISEFVLTIHWMVSAGRFLAYPDEPPESDGSFCQANAYISMIAGAFEFLYNCCFCIFVIFKIKSDLKGGIKKIYFHLSAFAITIILMIILGCIHSLGKNIFGTCSVKAVSTFPVIGPILLFIYVVLASATIIYFRKRVPNDERFREYKENFLNYYYKYVKICVMIWSFLAFCNIAAIANCLSIDGGVPGLYIVLTLGNISKLFTPLLLSFIRLQDPFLKKKAKRFFRKLRNYFLGRPNNNTIVEKLNPQEEEKNSGPEGHHRVEPTQFEVTINRLEKNPMDSESLVEDQDIWLNILKNDIKVQFTYTMLSGVLLNYKNVRGALEMSKNPDHQDFSSFKRYQITHDTLNLYMPNIVKLLNEKNYKTFPMNMIVYAPEAFEDLIEQDQEFMDLDISLDIEKNYENIQKASGADGGKGGEFFFFSYDNKVIIKTLSKEDLEQLRGILKDYYHYLKKNKDSMIAKIYGIYTFERKDIKDQSTSVLLMRNISACPRQYVLRTYDLKGSTFDREVLKKNPDVELNKVTLKDLDFLKLEKKIFIEEKYKKRIHEILEKDSAFFMKRNLIDYSLIVFIIDKKKYLEDLAKEEGKTPGNFFLDKRELYSLKSVKSDGLFYHIGIIDYLQPYNLQKYLEKISKKIIKVNKDLNTSSQDPKTYKERFCKFAKEII